MSATFTLSVANVRLTPKNTLYARHEYISNAEELARALQFDHMAGVFKNDRRSNDNFIETKCLMMDCDNDYTENPNDWITPEKLHDGILQDIEFYSCYSRSHMKDKDKYSARPRFHIYLPLHEAITDAVQVRQLKEKILRLIPDADKGAKDCARYFNGVENPEVKYFEGNRNIVDVLNTMHADSTQSQIQITESAQKPQSQAQAVRIQPDGTIPQGQRNSTLYRRGIHYILVCDTQDSAKYAFWEDCKRCKPLLSNDECRRIWESVLNSGVAKLKFIAVECSNEHDFIAKAQSITTDAEIIKKVCSCVFKGTIMQEIYNLAVKYMMKYKTPEAQSKHFWKDTSEHVYTLGVQTLEDIYFSALNNMHVKAAILARKNKGNAPAYYEQVRKEGIDNEAANNIWDSENREKEPAAESTRVDGLLGRREKPTAKIIDVDRALQDLGISLRLNVITQKLDISGLPKNEDFLPIRFHELSIFEQRRIAIAALADIITPYLRDNRGLNARRETVKSMINVIADINQYNPIHEMLKAHSWDGGDRISELCEIANVSNNRYYCIAIKKWLHQSIAMALNDNAEFSNAFVLTLQGPQGIGKTEFFRRLAMRNDWFKEGLTLNLRDKDSIIPAESCWIDELGELESTLQRDQPALKAYITRITAEYRRPYGDTYVQLPRRCSFCATVNAERFLRDTEGGTRRWATLHVTHIDHEKLRSLSEDWYIQLWAQAYQLFLQNNQGYRFTHEEELYFNSENLKVTQFKKGEREILEFFNWSADESRFQWKTAGQIEVYLKDTYNVILSAENIGAAIKQIQLKDSRVKIKRVGAGKKYFIAPPDSLEEIMNNLENIDTQEEQEAIDLTTADFSDTPYEEIQRIVARQIPDFNQEKIRAVFEQNKNAGGFSRYRGLDACKLYGNELHNKNGEISGYVIDGVYKAS